MIIKPFGIFLTTGVAILAGCAVVDVAEVVSYKAREAAKEKTPFQIQEEAIYASMKRYGINRDDMAAMRRLYESVPPYFDPHINVLAETLLDPGENYRIEMDEFILTMKVPDAPVSSSWIRPYTNTRTPDPRMAEWLKREKGSVQLTNLGWYVCNSLLPHGMVGRCDTVGISSTYRILKPEERENFSTPENLRKLSQTILHNQLPSREKIEASKRRETVINHAATRIALDPEKVVINGRVWVRNAMDRDMGRRYVYTTTLSPDRMLSVSFGLPSYDYTAHPDPSTWPAPSRRAQAIMEETVNSLRIAKINDDGTPDPFVIERVEPAPLPVREKRPEA